MAAWEKIQEGDIRNATFWYSFFVKRAKVNKISPEAFEPVRPRCICGVSDAVKAASGPWFLARNDALKLEWHPLNVVWFACGYVAEDFGLWGDIVTNLWPHYLIISADYSKFDATQWKEIQEGHVWKYLEDGFAETVPFFKEVLRSFLYVKAFGKGIKSEYHYRMQSGRPDTCSGNSETTGEMGYSFFAYYMKLIDFRIGVQGDDKVIAVNRIAFLEAFGSVERFIRLYTKHSENAGLKVKISVVDDIVEADFLSCRWYMTRKGYKFGKKPGRTLAKIGWFLHSERNEAHWRQIFHGTLLSMLNTSMHVPFLRVYVSRMLKWCVEKGIGVKEPDDLQYKIQGRYEWVVDETTWIGFEKVYSLGQSDEDAFAQKLEAAIGRYGVPCMMDMDLLGHLVTVDSGL